MTKQKRGLWVFLFSLIPGAGEMYMGFRKQGLSIMMLFWGIIAVAACLQMGWLTMFLPILWFYSFFNVHNLKSLDEEDFYSIEDTFILHLDRLLGSADDLFTGKYRIIIAVLLLVFGISILWNCLMNFLYWLLPSWLFTLLHELTYQLPQIVIAIVIIYLGIYILSGKKKQIFDNSSRQEEPDGEHYWEPYRPYQQTGEQKPALPEDEPENGSPSLTPEDGSRPLTPEE